MASSGGAVRSLVLALSLIAIGCDRKGNGPKEPAKKIYPNVQIRKPEMRTITKIVEQPGAIESFEQTPIYSKVAGYVEKYAVDIGDRVKKGELICQLYAPELVADLEMKKASVGLANVNVEVSKKIVDAADATVKTSVAKVAESKAAYDAAVANYDRWKSESERDAGMVRQQVLAQQIADESLKQFRNAEATKTGAQAMISLAEATLLQSQADLAKAKADVDAAIAQVAVAKATEQQAAALVSYLTITSPYDGVITERKINSGDFLQPAQGDNRQHLYVVARTDLVRVFVQVPELEAPFVDKGTKGSIRIQALPDLAPAGDVTRTSWAVRSQTRTLLAEIDLPNPGAKILPGMYAYASLEVVRPNVRCVPAETVFELGDTECCFLLYGKVARLYRVRTGLSDGSWTEVASKQAMTTTSLASAAGKWDAWTGDEQVLEGSFQQILNGEEVNVLAEKKTP